MRQNELSVSELKVGSVEHLCESSGRPEKRRIVLGWNSFGRLDGACDRCGEAYITPKGSRENDYAKRRPPVDYDQP